MNDRLMTSMVGDCPGECREKKTCRAITCIIASCATMTNDTICSKRALFYVIWKMNNMLSMNAFETLKWFNRLFYIVLESLNRLCGGRGMFNLLKQSFVISFMINEYGYIHWNCIFYSKMTLTGENTRYFIQGQLPCCVNETCCSVCLFVIKNRFLFFVNYDER